MAELAVSATASLSANGKNTATGSITWTEPTLPDGVSAWDSITLTGSWKWNGPGGIETLTVNGVTIPSDTAFTVPLGTSFTPPVTTTCVTSNPFIRGDKFIWSNLTVTYAYTEPSSQKCYLKVNGVWTECSEVYKKIGGVWVQQQDLSNVFDGEHYWCETI